MDHEYVLQNVRISATLHGQRRRRPYSIAVKTWCKQRGTMGSAVKGGSLGGSI